MILLPAIDIRDGRAVRLRQGDFAQETVYADSPVEAAREWVDDGAEALHVVDLDGARAGEPAALGHLEEIAALGVPVQFGGGLRSERAVRDAIAAGAQRVVIGTAAFRDPDLLDAALGAWGDRVAVGLDVRGGAVAVAGWAETEAGYGSPAEAIAALHARGVTRFVYTSVDRDGMLEGPDLAEVRAIGKAVEGRFVYSAGVGSLDHLRALRDLDLAALEGVIAGKALYERRFTVAEGRAALAGEG